MFFTSKKATLPFQIQLEFWDARDNLIAGGTEYLDLIALLPSLGEEDREGVADAIFYEASVDYDDLFYIAQELALIDNHRGPFTVRLDESRSILEEEDWWDEEDPEGTIKKIVEFLEQKSPSLRSDLLSDSRIQKQPVSAEIIRKSANDGIVQTVIKVPVQDLVAGLGGNPVELMTYISKDPVDIKDSDLTMTGIQDGGLNGPEAVIQVFLRLED